MSGINVKLKLKDLYIFKHALQAQINTKNKRLEIICTSKTECWDNELGEEFHRLNADMKYEERLLQRIEVEIDRFEKPIGRKKP